MKDKKLLLLETMKAQGLAKGYKLEVPVFETFDNDAQKCDIHSQDVRSAKRDTPYYRTMQK